jgi:hypothetical protein
MSDANIRSTNCPETTGPDFDFGSSAILVDLGNGKRALISGQKSGVITALDPDRDGDVLWQRRIGKAARRAECNGASRCLCRAAGSMCYSSQNLSQGAKSWRDSEPHHGHRFERPRAVRLAARTVD